MRRVTTIILLLTTLLAARAQTVQLFSSDKLSNSGITNICQDNIGYIWIATEYGLNRFDGYRFTHYLNNPKDSTSLKYNSVCHVFCDDKGRLWVGTTKGLQRYDYATARFENYAFPNDYQPRVNDIIQSDDGRLFFGTAGYGLYTLDERTGRLAEVVQQRADTSDHFYSHIFEDIHGGFWKGGANRFSYLPREGAFEVFNDTRYGVPTGFFNLDGKTVIVCRDKLLVYDDGQLRDAPFDISEAGSNPGFRTAMKDRQGNVYVGTRGNGLFWVPAGSQRLQHYPVNVQGFDLNASRVWALAEDRQGNIWVGCQQKGLLLIPNRKAQFASWSFAAQKVEIGTYVSSVAEGDSGTVWCTVQNKGVYGFDKQGKLVAHPQAPDGVEFIFRDSKKQYWLGTTHALYTYNPVTNDSQLLTSFECDKFNVMADDGRGTLAISAFSKGLLVYNRATGSLDHYHMRQDDDPDKGRLNNDWIMTLLTDREGNIWIGTSDGVCCLNPTTRSFKPYGWATLSEHKMVTSLCETSDGDILIGLEQGLCVWRRKTNRLEEFPSDGKPLQEQAISYITTDNEGNIWCSTLNGIWHYHHADGKWVTYASGSGLTSREYMSTVGMHTSDDRIFFATADGLTTFTPQQVHSVQVTPGKLRLTAFYIDGRPVSTLTESNGRQVTDKPVDQSNRFTVSYLDNSFLLEFSLLNFANASNTILEHRLNGSSQWIANEAGQNSISLSHLPGGTYQMEVRAIDNGVPSEPMVVTIVVTPPWYRSTLAYCLYALLLLILLVLMALAWRRSLRRRIDEDKMKFLINATHDIRSPLTLIMGAMKKLKSQIPTPSTDALDTIDRNASRILSLVNQILDVRKIDKQQMHLHCRETDLTTFIQTIFKVYEYNAHERSIHFTFQHPDRPVKAWIDRTQFDKVISNLLSNAFKYSFDHSDICVTLTEGENAKAKAPLKHYIEITVSDTGMGMGDETLQHLFDRFFQGKSGKDTNIEGTGIGLNLCKMIVDMHHGTISGSNRTDGQKGSVFTVRIPKGSDHLSEAETDHTPDQPATVRLTSKKQPNTNYHILIVDDDEEIPRYIAQELSSYYHFTTCPNGKEALKELLTTPRYDLVVSDVMMPEMDGFTMLRMLRTNGNISHLPVIMLTSKSEIANRLEGLDKGADAYLTKPFSIDELHATIDNLIASRLRLRGKYSGSQQPMEKVEQLAVKGNDEQLMERIMKSINEHLGDSDFSVETLCQDAGISRAHLHRKMKDLTGIPISEFIRNIRLEQAARLLREQKLNITQVAYTVGFSSLPYFSSVFRKHFGLSPRDFIEQQEK